jgi:hypothetical protein
MSKKLTVFFEWPQRGNFLIGEQENGSRPLLSSYFSTLALTEV